MLRFYKILLCNLMIINFSNNYASQNQVTELNNFTNNMQDRIARNIIKYATYLPYKLAEITDCTTATYKDSIYAKIQESKAT